ncbi:MAG: hypothetical protein JJU45_11410 [Acidimicrobiia bacterium]|nr:hypothetical protein [Acidimicrobiia bacterium]
MLIATGPARTLGTDAPRLVFGEEAKPEGAWAGRRLLQLDGSPAFELSYWCGTCQFLFRRLEGANQTVSLVDAEGTLRDGVDAIDDELVDRFGSLLATGTYIPVLLEVQPDLVLPAASDDYYSVEQVATWGVEAFWGLPEHPRTPYYRTFQTSLDAEAHMFEFVVPMVPPTWNDPQRVALYKSRLGEGTRPTAVAVSTLDVCEPATNLGDDMYAHWGLTHFLLDGHHKLHAASEAGLPLTVLSLLSVDGSLANQRQIDTAIRARGRPASNRQTV